MGIDWTQYQVQDEPQGGLSPDVSEQDTIQGQNIENEPINWGKYAVDEPTKFEETFRHASRVGARVGETILGFPGNFVQFSKGIGQWLEDKGPLSKDVKKDPNFVQRFGQRMLEKLPTSEDIKKKNSEMTEGFVDPQNAAEEFGDDIVELSSLLLSDKSKAVTKTGKIVGNLTSALSKSFAAKSTGKVLDAYGLGDKSQFAGEIGTLILMSMVNGKMASKAVGDKFKQAKQNIPPGTMANTSSMASELDALERELSRGVSTASKNEVKQAVSELKAKASGGSMEMLEIVESIHDINERMSSRKLFDELSRTEQRKLKMRYGNVKDVVGTEVAKYGKTNQAFYQPWLEGMEGFAAIENSKKATKFMERHVGRLPPKVAQGMVVETLLGHPVAAGATGAAFAGLKTFELMHRITNSPVLFKHYSNVLSAAAAENSKAMINSMVKLDEGINKSILAEDKKEKDNK